MKRPLAWIYAWGIASDVVAKGGAPKPEAELPGELGRDDVAGRRHG